MSTATDGFAIANASATSGAFRLKGGNYNFEVVATFGGGNVQLQVLGPDDATWLPVGSSVTAAGVTALANLAAGQYRIAITTATAVFARLAGVPG